MTQPHRYSLPQGGASVLIEPQIRRHGGSNSRSARSVGNRAEPGRWRDDRGGKTDHRPCGNRTKETGIRRVRPVVPQHEVVTGWDHLRDDWSYQWLSRGEIGLQQGLVVDEYRVTGRGDRLALETDDPLYEGTHRGTPEGAGRGTKDHDVSSVQDHIPGDDTDSIAGVKGRFHGGRHLDKETDVTGVSAADGRWRVRPCRVVAVEGATSEDSHDHE